MQMTGSKSATLERLLDDNRRFDLEARGTVNHMPMALVALSRMGADDERLVAFSRWWEATRALPRREPERPLEPGGWPRHIGDAAMFAALSDCFRGWILDRGSADVVATVFPAVARGVAAAAFHGLIRLAYGIEADHAGEIGAGLATLCAGFDDLGDDAVEPPPGASVEAAFLRLSEAFAGGGLVGPDITGRMRMAAADPRFRAALSIPPIGPSLLPDLARASIAVYCGTADFTALHMVTATHAARVLFGRFPDLASRDAIVALWRAACAAYASIGAPAVNRLAVDSPAPWRDIVARAVASNDDHVIKMTYTCRCEAAHYRNPLYRRAAAALAARGRA